MIYFFIERFKVTIIMQVKTTSSSGNTASQENKDPEWWVIRFLCRYTIWECLDTLQDVLESQLGLDNLKIETQIHHPFFVVKHSMNVADLASEATSSTWVQRKWRLSCLKPLQNFSSFFTPDYKSFLTEIHFWIKLKFIPILVSTSEFFQFFQALPPLNFVHILIK